MNHILRLIENLPIINTFNWNASSARNFRYTPLHSTTQGQRRHATLANLSGRAKLCIVAAISILILLSFATFKRGVHDNNNNEDLDPNGQIPIGQSRIRNGREVFWWEQFPELTGYFSGRRNLVRTEEYVSEQDVTQGKETKEHQSSPELQPAPTAFQKHDYECFIDEDQGLLPPTIQAYNGLMQHFPAPLFGDANELGVRGDFCYDRVNRFAPYGLGISEAGGGLGVSVQGDNEGAITFDAAKLSSVKWHEAQKRCIEKRTKSLGSGSRSALIVRTWNTFDYTPTQIMIFRAMISELSLASGGDIEVHFLIHVQNDSIPIWASEEVYNETLRTSLPSEFQGMGTLWSVAQMKLIYPPPFPDAIINFSGGNIYDAYRSLHFPLQYFASKHPEFDYIWHWETDLRVTGHYHELLSAISSWADKQTGSNLWERSSKFYIPALHDRSYKNFAISVVDEMAQTGKTPISGPQLPASQLLPIPAQDDAAAIENGKTITDFIAFNPMFDPSRTHWAFRDDITGYPPSARPATRASLITASRLSRRLLLLMHEETYRNKHTMFPEMYPASTALHYGLKAVYVPLPIYFDRDWPAQHADEVFNNAPISTASREAGMNYGDGYFHGEGGSVFGPAEHVFRGASYYSNAGFAQNLWRKWLGHDGYAEKEVGLEGTGRMCLPMMVLHPIKDDG